MIKKALEAVGKHLASLEDGPRRGFLTQTQPAVARESPVFKALLGLLVRFEGHRKTIAEKEFSVSNEVPRRAHNLHVSDEGASTVAYTGMIDTRSEEPNARGCVLEVFVTRYIPAAGCCPEE